MQVYNFAENSWNTISPQGNVPQARYHYGLAQQGSLFWIIGGQAGDGAELDDVWTFDASSNTWVRRANLPVPLSHGGAASDPSGNIIVFGGLSGGRPTSTTWRLITDIIGLPAGTPDPTFGPNGNGIVTVSPQGAEGSDFRSIATGPENDIYTAGNWYTVDAQQMSKQAGGIARITNDGANVSIASPQIQGEKTYSYNDVVVAQTSSPTNPTRVVGIFGVDTIALDPAENYLYVTNPTLSGGLSEIAIVDLNTVAEVGYIPAMGIPSGIAFTTIDDIGDESSDNRSPAKLTTSDLQCVPYPVFMTAGSRQVTDPASGREATVFLINEDGTPRDSFNTNALAVRIEGWYQAVAMLPDCTIVAVGQKGLNGGYPLIRAYNPDGTLNTSFNNAADLYTTGPGAYLDMAVQNPTVDTNPVRIIAVGYSGNSDPVYATPAVHAYGPDGQPDSTFNALTTAFFSGKKGSINSVAIQSDGKIVVTGNIYKDTQTTAAEIMRFLADGTPDATFGNNGIVLYDYNPFVTVGGSGAIYKSPDGKQWTDLTSGTVGNLNGIAYGKIGNGYFAAVGDGGRIMTSTDGGTWEARASPISNTLNDVGIFRSYPNRFAAVGDGGTILLSPDGVQWTAQTSGTTANLNGITYGQSSQKDYLVAVGDQGRILASAYNNLTRTFGPWTALTSPTSKNINSITFKGYGESFLVAVGNNGTILTSNGVAEWVASTAPVPGNLNRVFYNTITDLFVAVGDSGAILTSKNGKDWTVRAPDTSENLKGITYGNDKYVVTGDNGTVLISEDGMTWTRRIGINGNLRAVTNGAWSHEVNGVALDSNGRIVVLMNRNNGIQVIMRLLSSETVPQTPEINVSPKRVNLPAVNPGETFEKQITVTNIGNGALTISNIAVTNPLAGPLSIVEDVCSSKTLESGMACIFKVRFSPTTAALYEDSFDIPSNDALRNPVTVYVKGTPEIAVEPVVVRFSPVPKGNITEKVVKITNKGSAELRIGPIGSADPLDAPFAFPTGEKERCSNSTLLPSQSCSFSVRFSPTASGVYKDSFDIPSNDLSKDPVVVPLSVTPGIVVDPAAVDFGTVVVGDGGLRRIVISNSGYSDLNILSVGNVSTESFRIVSSACTGKTLTPSGDCSIYVGFEPKAAGTSHDSITIESDDPVQGHVTVTLTGNGMVITNPNTLTVILSGAGKGLVTGSPGGIYCGDDCTGIYQPGTNATLTAVPDAGYAFAEWQGACIGTGTACVVAMDTNKTVTAVFSETTPPTGSISINNGTKYTTTTSVTLNLTCTDVTGCAEMRFSHDGKTWSDPETFAATKAWQLTEGDGTKAIYVQYRDGAGNWSDVYGSTIGLNIYLQQYASTVINYSSQYGSSSYSAQQALLEPNVTAYKDDPKAWAPKPKNGTKEYIILGFTTPVYADSVVIRETYGNGFIYQIDVVDVSDNLHKVWEGVDPSQPGTPVEFDVSWNVTAYLVKGVKVYVDTDHNLSAWEEIDSVQLGGYIELPQYLLTVVKAGTGNGTVSGGAPSGIDCGDTCSYLYDASSTVILVAASDEGAWFTGWQGPCTGAGQCEFTMNGDTRVTAIFDQGKGLTLNQGWNFISLPTQPMDPSINVVLKDISHNVRVVWGYDNENKQWLGYKPSGSRFTVHSSLQNMEAGKGYWVYMDNPATLSIAGTDASPVIQLYEGWNLAGYLGTDGTGVSTALNSISDKWIIIWGWENGQWFAKHKTINDLPTQPLNSLSKGKAYWIKVKEAAKWEQ